MKKEKDGKKRYNLALPMEMYDELQKVADKEGRNLVDVFRRFISIGLALTKLQENDPDAALILRTEDTETRIMLL